MNTRIFENNQSFYSIDDFLARFTSQKVSPQDEKSNVSSRRMGVGWFHFKIRKYVYDVAPVKQADLFLPLLVVLLFFPLLVTVNWLCILLSSNFLFVFNLLNAVELAMKRNEHGRISIVGFRTDGGTKVT